jgi:hypothetical protein
MLDVTDSEPQGCRTEWFVDGHHATGECFTRLVPLVATMLEGA